MLSIHKPKAKSVRLPFLFALILIVCIALSACNTEEHRLNSLNLLTRAASLMESDAEGALAALKGVNSAYLETSEYYYYFLLSARISSMLGADMSDMGGNITNAIGYFTEHNDAKSLTLAYYVQAKLYEAKKLTTNALSCYKSADFWAEKASYTIPYFTYAAIPYNIASYHKRSNEYRISLNYLNKVITHADSTHSNTERTLMLYTLELMGINYMYLNMPDSSFYYYDKAFELADQMGASYPKQRITGNRI